MNNKPTSRFLLTLLGRDVVGRKDFIDKRLRWNENLKTDSMRRGMLKDALMVMLAPKPFPRQAKQGQRTLECLLRHLETAAQATLLW